MGSLESLAFQVAALWFGLRDRITPPEAVLDEVEIKEGSHILDYGCGPGSFTLLAARRVGPAGTVYAADTNPLALRHVQKAAAKRGLGNIEVIHTDCRTGLENETVDIVLLYDNYHDLEHPASVLEELHRVLRPQGLVSFSDHHMREEDILREITGGGSFRLVAKGKRTYTCPKAG